MRAVAAWLGPAYGEPLRFEPDVDRVEALSDERAALWKRVNDAAFLTEDEKRAAVGYGPKAVTEAQALAGKLLAQRLEWDRRFNPNHDELGRLAIALNTGLRPTSKPISLPRRLRGNQKMARGSKPASAAKSSNGAANNDASAPVSKPAAVDRFTSGYDFLLANGPVDERMLSGVVKAVTADPSKKNPNVLLCLTTYGGIANDAYRIGRLLQSVYNDVDVLIPSLCKSAGTLIVTAAKSVIMTPFGELGPLDVQVLKRDELFERRSGLITNYALEELNEHAFSLFELFMLRIKGRGGTISFKMASEIAARVSGDIMKHVYEHINVESLGEDARNLAVASEYCKRLDERFSNLKPSCIDDLVHGYVSHDFVIDSFEAQKLFKRVERAPASLFSVLEEAGEDAIVTRPHDHVIKMLTLPAITDTDTAQKDHADEHDIEDGAVAPNGKNADAAGNVADGDAA